MRPWIRRLSGTTWPPSTAASGVASWISCLRGSRASPGHLPASASASRTNAGSGQTYIASFARWDQSGSSWRTYPALFMEDLSTFCETWPRRGSMRNGTAYRRPKLAQRSSGSGSTYWPAPRAEDAEFCVNHPGAEDSLTGTVRLWSGPRANDPEKRGDFPPDHRSGLAGAAQLWPTATTKDANSSGTRKNGVTLTDVSVRQRLWTTPTVDDARGRTTKYAQGGPALSVQTALWATPTNADTLGGHLSRGGNRSQELLLRGQASNWASPIARDHRSPHTSDRSGSLPLQATGPQIDATAAHGRVSLNPRFVEWLMGWPRGWTDCGSPVTEWCRWLRQSRSYAYAIAFAQEDVNDSSS